MSSGFAKQALEVSLDRSKTDMCLARICSKSTVRESACDHTFCRRESVAVLPQPMIDRISKSGSETTTSTV